MSITILTQNIFVYFDFVKYTVQISASNKHCYIVVLSDILNKIVYNFKDNIFCYIVVI